VHAAPRLEVGYCSLDDISVLVNHLVELLMPFEQLAVGWLLERCGDAAPDISLEAYSDGLVEL
jgi:hypothetical protein